MLYRKIGFSLMNQFIFSKKNRIESSKQFTDQTTHPYTFNQKNSRISPTNKKNKQLHSFTNGSCSSDPEHFRLN